MDLLGILPFILYLCQEINAYEINNLFPEDYSSVYTYHVTTNTGVKKPESATSLWELTAGIVINSNANYSIIQLTDVRMKTYNGPENEDADCPTWSMIDTEELTDPFVIQYENGLVQDIFLDPKEEVWISNIKRGLASLLQIDIQQLDKFAYTSTEKNIYGSCLVEYTVINDTNEMSVRKFVNNDKCVDIPFNSWSSAPKSVCPSKHQNSIISSSERYFKINNTNDTFEIINISGHGTLLVQPFEAYGDAYYLETRQELELKKRTKTEFPQENFLDKLLVSNLMYEQNTYDFTNGRRKLTKQEKIESIHDELDKLINSFEENHSIYKTKKLHRGTLQLLYFQMRTLDISELHRIYSDLGIGTSYQQESKAGIFLELLPQIGSEASSQFIKDLILSRNVKDILAVKLLTMLPFYIEYTNDLVLASFEPLLSLSKDFSISIRHTAVLSFSTMVYKTFTAGKCSMQTYEKYVRKFLDLFSDSIEYEQEMLYLQGLHNLQLGSVAKYLIPVISKGTTYSHHTRFLAVWASMNTQTLTSDEVYKIYWPILEDSSEHLEMRVAAFLMLLTSEPTTGRLVSLYWLMQKEKDPHLYNFYYTTLISVKETTYPCYLHLGALASQIIRFAKQPETKKYWVTGNYLFDYNDANREFGSMSQFILVGNPKTDQLNVFYVTLSNYVMGFNVNQFALYLKVQGVSESILDKLSHINGQNVDVSELITILQDAKVNLQSSEPVHIEIIAKIEGKTIFSKYINETTFNSLGRNLHDIKSEYHINYQHIGITLASRDFYPSDFGSTIWISTLSGASASVRGNFTFSTENGSFMRQNDLDFRYSFQTQLTLFSYNPILDSYHGIERQKVVHGIFPMLLNITLNMQNLKLSTSFQQSDGPIPSVIFHTRLITFFRSKANSQNVLNGFCPKCKSEYEVTSINKFKNKEVLNIDSKEMYRKLRLSLFNCDSPYNLKNIYYDISQSHRFNSKVFPFGKYFLLLQHILDYVSFIPTIGQCGAAFIVESLNEKLPTIHWVLQINQQPEERQFIIKNGTTFHTQLLHEYEGKPPIQVFDAMLTLETFSNEVSDILLVANRKTDNIEKYCFHSNARLPQRSYDMFSYEPIEEVQIIGDISWGIVQENETECPYNKKRLHWNITGELTEEQRLEIRESKIWPFKQCKEMKQNLQFTPLSEECYRASFAASTPHKYNMQFYMENLPEWFYNSIKRFKCLFGIFENINIDHATTLNASVEYTENQKSLQVNINNENNKIENVFWDDVSLIFPNMRFPIVSEAIVSLGLINSCIITTFSVRTIENVTVINNDTNLLALADCSYYPKFALFVSRDTNNTLSFKMHTGKNTATVTKINGILTTQINGVEIDAKNGFEYPLDTTVYDFKIYNRNHGIVEIDSKFSGTWLYFTDEYVLITTPGFYKGRLCGKCILPKH